MTRTGRSPQAIVDDATWGSFEAGWRDGQGADADHLKTAADITACAAAGFTMFTIDPGEHVDPRADAGGPAELRAAWDALPWERLEDNAVVDACAAGRPRLRHRRAARVVRRGRARQGRREVRPRRRPRDGDVPPPLRGDGRQAVRPRSVGGRDRHADRTRRARVRRLRASPPRRPLVEPCAALRRPVREGRRLHRRPRGLRGRLPRARGHRPRARALQDQPALGVRQVQHLRHRRGRTPAAWCT